MFKLRIEHVYFMCFVFPAKVVAVNNEIKEATVELQGIIKKVDNQFVKAKLGEYILIQQGRAIMKIEEEKAKETMEVLARISKRERKKKKEKT